MNEEAAKKTVDQLEFCKKKWSKKWAETKATEADLAAEADFEEKWAAAAVRVEKRHRGELPKIDYENESTISEIVSRACAEIKSYSSPSRLSSDYDSEGTCLDDLYIVDSYGKIRHRKRCLDISTGTWIEPVDMVKRQKEEEDEKTREELAAEEKRKEEDDRTREARIKKLDEERAEKKQKRDDVITAWKNGPGYTERYTTTTGIYDTEYDRRTIGDLYNLVMVQAELRIEEYEPCCSLYSITFVEEVAAFDDPEAIKSRQQEKAMHIWEEYKGEPYSVVYFDALTRAEAVESISIAYCYTDLSFVTEEKYSNVDEND